MTPGINFVKKHKIEHRIHQYIHDQSSESFGHEAADKMGVSQQRVFKTLVVMLDNRELVVGILPVSSMLNLKLIAKASGAKKAAMASPSDVERTTGYVLGGVSPLGQNRRLRTFIDSSAGEHLTVYVSGGRRGLEIELSPMDLAQLTNATSVALR